MLPKVSLSIRALPQISQQICGNAANFPERFVCVNGGKVRAPVGVCMCVCVRVSYTSEHLSIFIVRNGIASRLQSFFAVLARV